MQSVPSAANEPTPLGVLGFTDEQEDLYRLVLRSSRVDLAGLAGRLDDPERLRGLLAPLVSAGLVELQGETVLARPPVAAVSRLISEEARRLQSRGERLDALRELLPSLSAEHLMASAPKGEAVTVELLDGGDFAQLVRSLSAASTGDLLWLRPDPWRLRPHPEIDDWVKNLVRAGRRSRAIYPARVLEEAPHIIRARAEAGEHVRILAEVPFRLAIMGSSAALIPEEVGARSERRLILRQHSLIFSLTLLFESLWEKAMAVPGLDGQRYDETASDQRLLLGQLAGGAKDEQIARALGISVRTVRRRVAELLDELGADSRFQAGVEAVRRGWM